MEAVFFTDLHVDDYKAFSFKRDRLEDCLKVIDDAYTSLVKRGGKHILFSGDMYNTTRFISTKAVNRLMERLDHWITKHPQIVWYAITGNHDFATKNLLHKPTESALSHIATAFPNNFKVIDNDGIILGDEYYQYAAAIYGIPNYEFAEHFQVKLQEAHDWVKGLKHSANGIKVTLMIHQSPAGQENPNVRFQTDPHDPLYKVFDMVLCGDIHTSQRITDNFLLGGNPLHKELTDAGKEKGIWKLDLTDPTGIKFISRKGRYPEFIRAKRGEPIADDPDNFIIQDQRTFNNIVADNGGQMTHQTDFGSNLPKEELTTNYWREANGTDKELLAMGLSFLK